MTTRDDMALAAFREAEALLEGHFLLTSGLHSPKYLQCALVLQDPERAARLCQALAEKLAGRKIDCVIGPAIGGIIVAYEMARAIGVRAIFTERVDGAMVLRRGFSLDAGTRVLLVEDVVTTGGSLREVQELVAAAGAKVVAVASLVDRTSGRDPGLGVPLTALLTIDVPTYAADECPLCGQGLPLVKPGRTGKK
jgi:orotate phosphoribosyltransferase